MTRGRRRDAAAGARPILVVGELAVALVLLAGAGLLFRSFVLMQRVDPGFASDRVLTFQVRMEGPRVRERAGADRVRQQGGGAVEGAPRRPTASRREQLRADRRPWDRRLVQRDRGAALPPGTTPPGVPYRVVTPRLLPGDADLRCSAGGCSTSGTA